MSIDLAAIVRRLRVDRRRTTLARRQLEALVSVADAMAEGTTAILLDTNVYIADLAGRLPDAARALVDGSLKSHCLVALAELATGLANRDPRRPAWTAEHDVYAELFSGLPASRVLTPDAEVWTVAGLVAGLLARTQHFQRHQRKECLNDALIFLTAAKAGLPVLTANREDFDLIQQVAGRGAFIWY